MDKDILGAKQCVKLPVNLSFYYSCFSYDCFKMLVSPSCSWRSKKATLTLPPIFTRDLNSVLFRCCSTEAETRGKLLFLRFSHNCHGVQLSFTVSCLQQSRACLIFMNRHWVLFSLCVLTLLVRDIQTAIR